MNYDKENGKFNFGELGKLFTGKNTKETKSISEEVKSIFSEVGDDFLVWKQDSFRSLDIKDEGFKNWVNDLDDAAISGKTAAEAMDMYQSSLASASAETGTVAKGTSTLVSSLKNIGGTLLSTLGNFAAGLAISAAISLVIKGIDYLIHYEDNLIKKGEEAKESITKTFDEFSSNKKAVTDLGKQFADSESDIKSTGDAIDTIAEKYTKLHESVNWADNSNKALSDSDYQEYLDISNQIADQFPTLVSGYDAQGNAILNLSSSASTAAGSLRELYDAQMMSANVKIGEELNDNYKGVTTQIKQYKKENDELQTQIDTLDTQISSDPVRISKGTIKIDPNIIGADNVKLKKELYSALSNAGVTFDEFQLEDGKTLISTSGISKELKSSIEDIVSKYPGDTVKNKNNLAVDKNELEKKVRTNEMLIKDQLNSMTESISQYMQTSSVFTNLNSKLQDAFLGNISNMDIDTISSDEYGGDVKKFIYGEFLNPMEDLKPEAQEKLADLLSLDSSNLNAKEYKNLINKTLTSVFPDQTVRDRFKKSFGFDNLVSDVDQQLATLKKQVSGFDKDLLDTLSMDEIKNGIDLTANDNFSGTFEDFKKKLYDAKALSETSVDLSANPQFDAIATAQESKNAGDDYVKSIEYLKTAKDLYDKGLVGTDDFKSVATYLSPTGADDAVNFAENYSKAARYITEDSAGVNNFLDDLKKKGYADFTTLSDGTREWTYNIQDLQAAATDMGMGFEWFMDMFGRLEDYGFHNNFVGSVEEGTQKIADLSSELVEAEAELERLKASGADDTAISQQEAKVAQIKTNLEETTKATEQVKEHAAEQYAKQVSIAKDEITALNEQRKQIQDSDYEGNGAEVKRLLGEKIKSLAQENGIELDASLNVVNNDETVQELETQKITIPVEYQTVDYDDVKGEIKKGQDALQNGYLVANNKHFKINLDTTDVNDLDKQIDKVDKAFEYLRSNNGGALNFDTTDVKDAINVLNALYVQKRKVADEKFDSMDLSGMDESLSSAIDKLHQFQQARIELERQQKLKSVGIEIDTSDAEESYNNLFQQIQTLDPEVLAKLGVDPTSEDSILQWLQNFNPEITAKLNIDKTKAENALKGIAYSDENEIIMKVGADTSQIQAQIDGLKDGQSAIFNASATDTNGKSFESSLITATNIDGTIHYYAEFEDGQKVEVEKNQDGTFKYKADVSEVEQATNDVENQNPEVKVELTPDQEKMNDAYAALLSNTVKTTVVADADMSEVQSQIDSLEVGHAIMFTANVDNAKQAVAAIRYQDGSIGYVANVDNVFYQLNTVQNEDGTISYTLGDYPTEIPTTQQTIERVPDNSQVISNPSNVGQTVKRLADNSGILKAPTIVQKVIRWFTGESEASGTAHLTGSAYASGTYSDSSFIKPNWQTNKTQTALTGEVGTELIVDPNTNTWRTVGDNGAEFTEIPKGAVVFNSKQTKELFSKGYTNSRGKGNPALPGSIAFASGTAYGGGGAGNGGLKPTSSSSSSSSKSNSSKSSSNSNSNNSNNSSSDSSEETKETLDWIETKLDRIKRAIDELDTTASSTYRTWSKRNQALSSELSKVSEEISLQQQAYDRYIKEANSVGLSEDWASKVRDGRIDIETITDSDLKDKISDYRNW